MDYTIEQYRVLKKFYHDQLVMAKQTRDQYKSMVEFFDKQIIFYQEQLSIIDSLMEDMEIEYNITKILKDE